MKMELRSCNGKCWFSFRAKFIFKCWLVVDTPRYAQVQNGLEITNVNASLDEGTFICNVFKLGSSQFKLINIDVRVTGMLNNERVNFHFILNHSDIKIFALKNHKLFVMNLKLDLSMLYFTVPPKITTPPSAGQAVVGEQYRFECLATGKPPPEYLWFKVN